jgi:hypothetical protein
VWEYYHEFSNPPSRNHKITRQQTYGLLPPTLPKLTSAFSMSAWFSAFAIALPKPDRGKITFNQTKEHMNTLMYGRLENCSLGGCMWTSALSEKNISERA